MFMVDCSDHQIALFRSVFRAEDDVLRFPERLRFDKVDAVFCFVAFAFPRIELEFHNADLTNAPASRASRAAHARSRAGTLRDMEILLDDLRRVATRRSKKEEWS
jgi:hypothetical protein